MDNIVLSRANTDDWKLANLIVTLKQVKRTRNSFGPYKSPGTDTPIHFKLSLTVKVVLPRK